jgi:hypothetical protein
MMWPGHSSIVCVLLEDRQTDAFHLVPDRREWIEVQAGHKAGLRTKS